MKIPPLSIKVENKQQEEAVCRVLESAGMEKRHWETGQYIGTNLAGFEYEYSNFDYDPHGMYINM